MFCRKPFIFSSFLLSLFSVPVLCAQTGHVFDQFGHKQAGTFIHNVFAANPQGIMAAPESLELELDGLGSVQLHISESLNEFNRQVLKGTLMQDGEPVPFSEVVLVQAKHDSIMGSIETPHGNWLIMPQYHGSNGHSQYLIKRHHKEIDDELLHDEHDQNLLPQINGLTPEQLIQAAPDVDPNGDTVIDIFMGFSERALPFVQDMEAYAVMQIATVNNALKNSQIENIRVRLVGTGTTHHHRGMDSTTLKDLSTWFADDIAKYSPDVVTGYFTLDHDYPNQAGGWGYVNGYYNINNVAQPHAFRHELGHNIGGVHCNDKAGYNFGFNNGMTKTHQCGNNINYYSNPHVTDMYGLAIGDHNTANMARIWRENAARHSSHRPALVPFENEIRVKALEKTQINISANGWDYSHFEVPQGATRMIVTLNEGALSHGGSHKLYVQKGENPTANGFHTTAKEGAGNSLSLAVNDISAGTWSVGINNLSSDSEDLILSVYLFSQNGEALTLAGQDDGHSSTSQDNSQDDSQDNSQDNSQDSSQDNQALQLAQLLSPQVGTVIDHSRVDFSADSEHSLWLFVGSSEGGADIYNAAMDNGQASVGDIELNGAPLFVTLWTLIDGDWQAKPYEFLRTTAQVNSDSSDKVNNGQSDHLTNSNTDNSQSENNSGNHSSADEIPNEQSQGPVVLINAPTQVQTPDSVLLDGSDSHGNNDAELTYLWRQEAGPNMQLQNSDQAQASFEAPVLDSDTQVVFSLTIFDGKELSKQEVSIRLLAPQDDNVLTEDKKVSDGIGLNGSSGLTQGGGPLYWLLLAWPLLWHRKA